MSPTSTHIATMASFGGGATVLGLLAIGTHDPKPGLFEEASPPILGWALTSGGLSLLLIAWVLHIITRAIAAHAEVTAEAIKEAPNAT